MLNNTPDLLVLYLYVPTKMSRSANQKKRPCRVWQESVSSRSTRSKRACTSFIRSRSSIELCRPSPPPQDRQVMCRGYQFLLYCLSISRSNFASPASLSWPYLRSSGLSCRRCFDSIGLQLLNDSVGR